MIYYKGSRGIFSLKTDRRHSYLGCLFEVGFPTSIPPILPSLKRTGCLGKFPKECRKITVIIEDYFGNISEEDFEALKTMSVKEVCSPESTLNYDKYFPENWRNL